MLRVSRRSRLACLLTTCLVLVFAVACTPGHQVNATRASGATSGPGSGSNLGVRPGPAAPVGGPPTVILAQTGAAVPSLAEPTSLAISRGNDALWGIDEQLGPAYDISVAAGTRPAQVRFPVGADQLATLLKASGGAASDLFIEMYSRTLGTWLPLPTTYDPSTHEVSATAPHFSRFGLGFIIRRAAQVLFPGVPLDAASLLLAKFSGSFLKTMQLAFSPEQAEDLCTSSTRDPAYVVATPDAHLSGCIETANGGANLLARNTTLVPFDLRPPAGGPPANLLLQDVTKDSLPAFITRLLLIPTGGTLLSGRGRAVLGVGRNTLSQSPFAVPTSADPFAIAADTIIALLSVLPPERDWEVAVNAVRTEIVHAVAAAVDPVTGEVAVTTVLRIVREQVQTKIKPAEATEVPAALEFTETLNSAYECLKTLREAPQKAVEANAKDGLTSAVFDAIITTAHMCLDTALATVGKSVHEDLSYGLSLFNAIPELARTAREDIQFAALGPKSLFSAMTVGHDIRADPNAVVDVPQEPCKPAGQPSVQVAVPIRDSVPARVDPPVDEVLYRGVDDPTDVLLGPRGYHCTFAHVISVPSSGSDNGYETYTLYTPDYSRVVAAQRREVPALDAGFFLTCQLLPAVRPVAVAHGQQASCPPALAGTRSVPADTGVNGLYAVAVTMPTDGLRAAVLTGVPGPGTVLGVVVQRITGPKSSVTRAVFCSTAGTLHDSCVAMLREFAEVQLSGDPLGARVAVQAAVDSLPR